MFYGYDKDEVQQVTTFFDILVVLISDQLFDCTSGSSLTLGLELHRVESQMAAKIWFHVTCIPQLISLTSI